MGVLTQAFSLLGLPLRGGETRRINERVGMKERKRAERPADVAQWSLCVLVGQRSTATRFYTADHSSIGNVVISFTTCFVVGSALRPSLKMTEGEEGQRQKRLYKKESWLKN